MSPQPPTTKKPRGPCNLGGGRGPSPVLNIRVTPAQRDAFPRVGGPAAFRQWLDSRMAGQEPPAQPLSPVQAKLREVAQGLRAIEALLGQEPPASTG